MIYNICLPHINEQIYTKSLIRRIIVIIIIWFFFYNINRNHDFHRGGSGKTGFGFSYPYYYHYLSLLLLFRIICTKPIPPTIHNNIILLYTRLEHMLQTLIRYKALQQQHPDDIETRARTHLWLTKSQIIYTIYTYTIVCI